MDDFPWNTRDDRLVITARGEAAPAAADVLHLRLVVLAGAVNGRIELDPTQLDFVDYAESRTLAALHRTATAHGGSVHTASVSPAAARYLELAGPLGAVPRILPLPTPPATAPASGTAPVAQTPADSTAPVKLGSKLAARWRSSARRHRTAAL